MCEFCRQTLCVTMDGRHFFGLQRSPHTEPRPDKEGLQQILEGVEGLWSLERFYLPVQKSRATGDRVDAVREVYSGRLEYICLNSLQITTSVHWCTIWSYLNFRLEFVMPYTLQHTRDVRNLSAYGYDCCLITGFPFALVFTCTFTEWVT